MKREIKFRGKSLKTGEWLYGDILNVAKETCIAPHDGDWFDFIPRTPNNVFNLPASKYAVDPDTVGQFTGLYDKNGKEIYEGDIVDAWSAGSHLTNGIIKWGLCRFFIGNEPPSIVWSLTSNSENKDELLEVIGNIHNNPELLQHEN